ncbi:Glutamine synthetase inactivating factor IF7 [Cyanobacterium sp. HL-69]|uniref:hypothetical protein n=1 Tax=unclassified Cyanobacterium TaxID=2629879 RepID=UPI0008528765|nr:hypothetical protein [Cyanobacterium sp. IPPAS B-1200]AUC61270.1 Glutamine synthetase inactivating factor IF7 [Cyanobacterium sp. HL-69]OEJ78033.1 hypothetical protein A5482_04245 [Cyanobacterium sp. IPPAS B-1200]
MNTKQQSRALMMRHQKMMRNRQQSMLGRVAAEIGMDVSNTEYYDTVKNAPLSSFASNYDRSNSSLS